MNYERLLSLIIAALCLFIGQNNQPTQTPVKVSNGIDGQNGIAGKNGIDGKNGKNGKDGVIGANGTNGTDGKNGADGKGFQTGLHVLVIGDCPVLMTQIGVTGEWSIVSRLESNKLWNTGTPYEKPYSLNVTECVIN